MEMQCAVVSKVTLSLSSHCQHESKYQPSSLRERSSILIFCKASSSSAHLERSFSKAIFMSQYCMGTAGWGCGARAPLVVVPTSSRRRPNIPWKEAVKIISYTTQTQEHYRLHLFKDLLWAVQGCLPDLFFLCGLVHFGLKKINKFGLLGDSPLHFYLFVRIYSLQERTKTFRGRSNSK